MHCNSDSTRRELLRGTLAAGAAAALQPLRVFAQDRDAALASSSAPAVPQAFRFVHFTDIHVQPELRADQGFAKALRAAEALNPRPDFILTGGDLAMDVMEADAQRSRALFELYCKVIADNTSLPVRNTLGNHDIFGWHSEGVTPSAAGYGRAMAREFLKLRETYYHFDHKGWRFFVLDNIQPGVEKQQYQGYLDGPQMDWLKQELERTNPATPIVTCEHIPMVTVTGFPFAQNYDAEQRAWRMGNNLICGDAAQRLALYAQRRVKLCLSGHIHQLDRIELEGTTFINDGAVCGAWWKGPRRNVREGFGVIDVTADGGIRHQYHEYGWVAAG